MDKNQARVNEFVEKLAPELKTLTLNIHDNPELGLQEVQACKWQMDLLSKYGFSCEDNFCDIKTAYKAVYKGKKSGPKIAMLAEYDALPELGHGCGHNLIAMVSVGAGIAMKDYADEYGGEIYVIGTPAEETAGAKVAMSKKGAFKDFDVAMMAHPAYISVDSVNTTAMNAYKLEFFGKPSHAAAAPEMGLNALDAMINFFNLVNALRQQTKEDARIHGVITNGGVAPNIIPDYTSALFYVRANRVKDVEELSKRIIDCAKGAALGTGTRVEVSKTEEDFKDTCSNLALSNLACDRMEELGEQILRLNGSMYVPGSSDLGDVSYECPAIQLGFKIGDPVDGNLFSSHTWDFVEKSASEEAIEAGIRYVKGFALTALELMTKPECLEAIKEEFATMDQVKMPF